jgi:hypothetical protein
MLDDLRRARRARAAFGASTTVRVIRGYTAIIALKAEGRDLTAFVAVRLARHQR